MDVSHHDSLGKAAVTPRCCLTSLKHALCVATYVWNACYPCGVPFHHLSHTYPFSIHTTMAHRLEAETETHVTLAAGATMVRAITLCFEGQGRWALLRLEA